MICLTLTARDKRAQCQRGTTKTLIHDIFLKQWDQNYELWMPKLLSHIVIIMTANFCFV